MSVVVGVAIVAGSEKDHEEEIARSPGMSSWVRAQFVPMGTCQY
jgi:hypothetical protein